MDGTAQRTWNWDESDEILAERLIAEPLGTDFFMRHPMGDLLFGRNGAPRDPNRYAGICALAAGRTKDPGIRLACRIEEQNGRRRARNADHTAVARELAQIQFDLIRDLQPGQIQSGLGGSLNYNLGIVLRGLRRYCEAGNAQLASGGWLNAAGKQADAQVALFVAATEYASDALVRGNPEEVLAQLLHLRQMRNLVRVTCPEYPRWMQDNATLHIWWAHFIAGQDYAERDADRDELRAGCYPHWKWLFDVTELTVSESVIVAADQALVALETVSSSVANVVLSLQICKARALRALGKTDEARACLTEVMDWSEPDGGVPMAVAAREIASLD